MASSYYANTLHVSFESVLAMDNPDMVSIFKALAASGLQGFLGCPAVIYEAALIDFFENALVRDGVVISTVAGKLVEISEELFAETFELPVEGLTNLSEIPKDLVFYAKSIVSLTGEPVNWNKILFNILKDMVTAETRKARGFAIQISLLLENIPNLELGESTEFPSSKILTEKTVHHYIILNEKVGGEDVTDAPRTTKSKAVSSKDTLDTLPVKAVPLQMIAPTTAALTEQLPVPKRPTQKRKRRLILGSDDEIFAEPFSEPAVADVVNEGPSTTDDVDDIIQQVLTETAQIGADKEEIDGGGETVSGPAVGSQAVDKIDKFEQWLNFSYEEFHARQANRPVETASDTEDEMDSDMGNQKLPVVGGTDAVLGTNVGVQTEASPDEHLVKESMESIEEKLISTDEAMLLEDILMSIPVDVPLPSASVEVTKITLGKSIKIHGVDERTCLKRLANLKIDDYYYAKEELVLSWAEAESTGVALQRRMYILLKYRELLIRKFLEARKINFAPGDGSSPTDLKILDRLSDLHLFVLEELKEQSLVHGLRWDKTCCSKIFEGRNRDRGAVIARSNTNTKSSCWIRTMLRVDGTWVIEPCADYWKPIPREVTSNMVVIPSRISYIDTLPQMSEFFKLLKKRRG
ncbi:hypothetical protein F511_23907 [Dorcoceras hygrometricum]|uniref:Dystroglycan-like n=1 Tax=Dorcoceras hygrometricum TaxID=472368 RepID=A0A2Z7A5Q2_9LAMI|nr:hypothetical protein F511_23907 [Dorcoceras hygrometricum]